MDKNKFIKKASFVLNEAFFLEIGLDDYSESTFQAFPISPLLN